ncbi:Magnesium and cobalt transport protein CorA [Devosia sp. DBB001]|nr:Magnesium and cobalt transport protein CorA [Devosia sp. DBB001]
MDDIVPDKSAAEIKASAAQAPGVVLVFDGKGGVKRVPPDAETVVVPPKGFMLISGNSKSPEFKMWLKSELGPFNADALTVLSTRSRCTVLDDKAVVVLRVARPGAKTDDLGRQLLGIWLEKGRVIVASELNIPEFLGFANWAQSHYAPVSPADLVARLGLRASDRIEPLIEHLGDSIDTIEEELMLEHSADSRAKLAHLRRTLIGFRKLLWPQRDVLNTLEIEDLSFFSGRDRARLREASSRTARLGDELQALSERAVLIHEQIMDSRAEQMNRSMLVLAAVTVVFTPLTVLSGIFGMNVPIPYADDPHAFWVVMALLIAVAGLCIWWMRARKWL